MHEEFDSLRKELEPIVESWELRLEELWETVKTIKDRNQRLPMVIEYNRFNELLGAMKFLKDDHHRLSKNSARISEIRREIYYKSEYENVGEDIAKLVDAIESKFKGDAPNMHDIGVNIKRAIQLLKKGENVVHDIARKSLINRLNVMIIERNKRVQFPLHGIIMQLREDKHFVHCVAIYFGVQCKGCNHIMCATGNSDCDVYGPIKCEKCGSFDMQRCNTLPSLIQEPKIISIPKKENKTASRCCFQ
jgi:hypothetical protein